MTRDAKERPLRRGDAWRWLAFVALAVVLAGCSSGSDEPGQLELRGHRDVAAEVEEGAGGDLLAVKQWTPERDLVLICENYDRFLPMRPADLWVEAKVPASGQVLVSITADTANSDPDLYDYWAVMVGDQVKASGRVGFGDTEHRVTARFLVTGLPAGETVRFDIAHRSDKGGTANIYLGPSNGPALMEVWTA